jgi:hypothetical protein
MNSRGPPSKKFHFRLATVVPVTFLDFLSEKFMPIEVSLYFNDLQFKAGNKKGDCRIKHFLR